MMCSTFLVMNDRNGKYKELVMERQVGLKLFEAAMPLFL